MALVALASAKGSPGVTTTALLLGALWPRPVLVAECDPAGSDVAHWLTRPDGSPLDPQQGLLSLAAAGRHGLSPDLIRESSQPVLGGLDVVLGISSPEQNAGLAALWPALGSALDGLAGLDVVADVGRVTDDRATLPVLEAARLVLFVCRPTLSSVLHLRQRISDLARDLRPSAVDGVPVGVVVVAPERRRGDVDGVRDVLSAAELPVQVMGHLAEDAAGAAALIGRDGVRLDRTLLVRSGRAVTATVAGALAPFSTLTPESVEAGA